jgi:hypothetical protein
MNRVARQKGTALNFEQPTTRGEKSTVWINGSNSIKCRKRAGRREKQREEIIGRGGWMCG